MAKRTDTARMRAQASIRSDFFLLYMNQELTSQSLPPSKFHCVFWGLASLC